MSKQQKRNQKVLERMIALSNDDKNMAEFLAGALEDMLGDLAMDDFFGTEGQCDPRGDGRNGHWTMKLVEGVDK